MASRSISLFQAFLMLVLIVFWGSSFVVVKVTLGNGLTPIAIATYRFLAAGGFFLITLLSKRSLNSSYRVVVEKKDTPVLLVLALTGITLFFVVQYTGIQMAGPSIAAILVCLLSPILITVLSARMFKEYLTRKQILGIIIAVPGTLSVISAGIFSIQGSSQLLMGSMILLLTPILWAIYTLLGKKIMEKYDALLVVAYTNVLGGLLLVPFSLAESSFYLILTLGINEWSAILYLSLTCSLLGYYLWFYVLGKAGAAASSFLFAEPLVTLLFAVRFTGETLNPYILVGGLLIFVGVYFVTRK